MKKNISKRILGSCLMLFFSANCMAQSYQFYQAQLMVDTLELEDYAFEYDYVPEVGDSIVEARLSSLNTTIDMTFNPTVRAFIDYFTVRNRDYTRSVAARTTKYFPLIEKYLKKYDLPDELKFLAIVESGLNPRAKSPAGAVGLWQFMPLTGRLDYGLYENWYKDDKMDFEKSTDAACRYLKFLHNYFNGNWQLALAAYNTGPGNIRKAIRRSGYKRSFWEIYPHLYRETRSYVPQFIAIVYALNFMDEHNLFVEEYEYMPAYEEVEVAGFLTFESIANLTNVDVEEIEDLNPTYKRDAIGGDGQLVSIRIPSSISQLFRDSIQAVLENSAAFKEKYEYLARNTVGSTYGRQKLNYTVQSGDVLGKLAMRYNVRVADIRKWNNLRSNTIRIGQKLAIWLEDGYYDGVNKALASKAQPAKTAVGSNNSYIVQEGDTLWEISRKYEGLSVEKLKKLNNLAGNAIKPGQVLRLKES